jgi:hypothetical protein
MLIEIRRMKVPKRKLKQYTLQHQDITMVTARQFHNRLP